MKKSTLLLLTVLFVFQSCQMRPFSVMDKDTMADVLFEIHLAEATISVHDDGYRRLEKQTYYESIFKKYDITKEDFDKSLDWYAHHPRKYDEVYVLVKAKLDAEEERVNSHYYHDTNSARNDSLKELSYWFWPEHVLLTDSLDASSVTFVYPNRNWFTQNDDLYWSFILSGKGVKADGADLQLVAYYASRHNDTISHALQLNGKTYRYKVHYRVKKNVAPDSIRFVMYAPKGSEQFERLSFDSIQLTRSYNYKLFPFTEEPSIKLTTFRDSIAPNGPHSNELIPFERVLEKETLKVDGFMKQREREN